MTILSVHFSLYKFGLTKFAIISSNSIKISLWFISYSQKLARRNNNCIFAASLKGRIFKSKEL